MSFFTKAVVRALQEFPDVNSMIDGILKLSLITVTLVLLFLDQRTHGTSC